MVCYIKPNNLSYYTYIHVWHTKSAKLYLTMLYLKPHLLTLLLLLGLAL
jgi:hypothetical protein